MRTLLFAALVGLLAVSCVEARKAQQDPRVYHPPKCSKICEQKNFFEEDLPEEPEGNKAYQWSIQLLSQLKENINAQSPPGVGRALAVFSACVYNAAAAFRNWKPAFIDKIPGEKPCGTLLVDDVINGAAFTAISSMFSDKRSFVKTANFFQLVSKDSSAKGLELGEEICDQVVETFKADGFSALGIPLDPEVASKIKHKPINKPQTIAGITQCDKEMTDFDKWQPLCVPTSFVPNKPVETCKIQEFLAPYAGQFTSFAIPDVDAMVPETRPPQYGSDEWLSQAEEVLEYSAQLTDATKLVAEYWADGPDTTFPPGHWYRIAAEAAKTEDLDVFETSKVLLLVGSALNDAGSACWECKRKYDSIRPLQMIQCGLGDKEVEAWHAPYMGIGTISASEWQPYQRATFVTPPFAGYVSGHSSFSAAAAKVLQLYFGDDTYRAPKCRLLEEGSSLFEGKITEGEPGYVKGLTDVPNKGPKSKGYVPAQDVVICWETFTEAAEQAGISRLHGGIHIIADHTGGARLGENVGYFVFDKGNSLWS